MAFHEAWKRGAAEATLCGAAPVLVLPGLREALSAGQCLLLIVGDAFVSTQTLLVSKRQPVSSHSV